MLINLYGGAQDANVRLEKSSVRIENTYIGMAKQRTVTITNRMNVIAHFRWSEFATAEAEDGQRARYGVKMEKYKLVGMKRLAA